MEYPRIIPTPSGYQFAKLIAQHLRETYLPKRGVNDANPLVPTTMTMFSDSHFAVNIDEHIRGRDVFVVADVESAATMLPNLPAAERNYKLYMTLDKYVAEKDGHALQLHAKERSVARAFAMLVSTVEAANTAVDRGQVSVVVPVMPNGRQDRRTKRQSLDLRTGIRTLERFGMDRLITLDVHNPATELACDESTRFDPLHSLPTFCKLLRAEYDLSNLLLVGPDPRAISSICVPYQKWLSEHGYHAKLGGLHKIRDLNSPNQLQEGLGYIGNPADIPGANVLLLDDMIDTGGSIMKAMRYLKQNGARSVRAMTPHLIGSGKAFSSIQRAHDDGACDELITTNSVTHLQEVLPACVRTVDISKYHALVIDRLHHNESISELLEKDD